MVELSTLHIYPFIYVSDDSFCLCSSRWSHMSPVEVRLRAGSAPVTDQTTSPWADTDAREVGERGLISASESTPKFSNMFTFMYFRDSKPLLPWFLFFTHSIPWGQLGDATVLLLHSTSKSVYQILVLPFLYDGKQLGILGNRGWHLCCNLLLMTGIMLLYFLLCYDLHSITLWPKVWQNSAIYFCVLYSPITIKLT